MIFITVLSILFFNSKTVESVDYERHCNFSRYMLNYFKLNEQYLLQMYKNVELYTEEDLKKYGQAIQTHADVVLLMIQDLHNTYENIDVNDLMTVNLYLNNNSGSINVMYKYQEDNDVDNNKVFLGIQGLKLQNYSMMTVLNRFINSFCLNETISEFVDYPNKNKSLRLNIYKLESVMKRLREKIIREINPEIVEKNNLKMFHPSNMLFYSIMLNQSNKNLAKGTESRQHQEFVDGKPKFMLDLLRFAPLSLQCADKTDLTITDVFRYVKYQYLYVDVTSFQKLLLAATFHPVGMLIANYIHFVREMVQIGLNPKNYIQNDKLCIKILGEKIKKIIQNFIDLNIFIESSYSFLQSIIHKFYTILSWVRGIQLKDVDLPNIILKELELFMNNNFLKFSIELKTIVTDKNVMHIHDTILEKGDEVESYLQELGKYTNSFEFIYIIQSLERIAVNDNKLFLLPDLINHLCADNPIDYFNTTNDNSDEFNVYDLGNNDGLDQFKTENFENFKNTVFKRKKSLNPLVDMKDLPKHMMDYFICPI
ncbi:uncharacterized protein LOC126902219 [Daktulosphaira vitifoliae]|uniref:uncharacterized protein LOC126902219 n=1 Tax=Daktulosphaira vitifoliae TaxID=58002 RepID=UPI0021A9AA02|nr:uncharacterized protein LOC126902219 [Daktulosphaira vitifoliae]